ncbi:MAG: hypothetical protein ACJAZO_003979 [Myxococcota bacterium]|jgi:hypothetical protein
MLAAERPLTIHMSVTVVVLAIPDLLRAGKHLRLAVIAVIRHKGAVLVEIRRFGVRAWIYRTVRFNLGVIRPSNGRVLGRV